MPNQQEGSPGGGSASAQLTAQKVIEMFAELDLLVCDDGDLIQRKFDAKADYYLELIHSPNFSDQAKGLDGIMNGEALIDRRPELIKIVYEDFENFASIESNPETERALPDPSQQFVDYLMRILRERYRVDDSLAVRFLEYYLQKRKSPQKRIRIFIRRFKEIFEQASGIKSKPRSIIESQSQSSPLGMPIIWRLHKFLTNEGEMTINDVLSRYSSHSFTVNATIGLHPHNPLLRALPNTEFIIDLSRYHDRAFAIKRIEAEGGRIQFVDDCSFIKSRVDIKSLSDDEHELKQWFENIFRYSRYLEGVDVAIYHSQEVFGLPAVLVPCRKIIDSAPPKNVNIKDFDHSWIRTSSALLLNAQSELVRHLKGFTKGSGIKDSELKNEIPSLVFRYAASFALERSLPDSDPGYQLDQWGALTQNIKVVARLELKLAGSILSSDEKAELEKELLEVRRRLKIAEEKLDEQI